MKRAERQVIRKERPLPPPKPPARPPAPTGIRAPGSGTTPGGMVCRRPGRAVTDLRSPRS